MRTFPVRVSGGLFLLLQALFLQFLWQTNSQTGHQFTAFLLFTIFTAIAGLAAVGFFFLYQSGWLLAMLAQGGSLFTALVIYFFVDDIPVAASQLTMLYSILMVLYLNSFFVRLAFNPGLDGPEFNEQNP